jgi:hypothetical protein
MNADGDLTQLLKGRVEHGYAGARSITSVSTGTLPTTYCSECSIVEPMTRNIIPVAP